MLQEDFGPPVTAKKTPCHAIYQHITFTVMISLLVRFD